MKVINIPYKTENRLDLVRVYVGVVGMLKGLRLSDTDILVISRFILDGYNDLSKEGLVRSGVRKNRQGVNNMLSNFRKLGLIVKEGVRGERMCDEFNLTELFNSINELEIRIKLDNK